MKAYFNFKAHDPQAVILALHRVLGLVGGSPSDMPDFGFWKGRCRQLILATVWLVAGIAFTVEAADYETGTKQAFRLPSGETLDLVVPEVWDGAITNSQRPQLLTIRFTSKKKDDFVMMLTAGRRGRCTYDLKQQVDQAAQQSVATAVESKAQVKELKGRQARGYYFSLTDKAPKPGEYKNLTQGLVEIGEIVVAFTILSNDATQMVREMGLQLVRSVVQKEQPGNQPQ